MGEGGLLGLTNNTAMKFFSPLFLIMALSSCAPIPKVIVLHDPLSADEHITLGLGYELNGEYDYAVQEYKKALKGSDRDYRPLFYLGNVYYKKKEYGKAQKYYNKALRIAPDNGDIRNNLAWVYMDMERYEDAMSEIEKASASNKSPYYLDTLAHIYDRMGKYEDAIEVLKEAIDITPASDSELLYGEHKLLDELNKKLSRDQK